MMSPDQPSDNRRYWWIPLALAALAADYAMSPYIRFPVAYMFPIAAAAWHAGAVPALALAIGMPLVRLVFLSTMEIPWPLSEAAVNAVVRIAVFVVFALLCRRTAAQNRELARRVTDLEKMVPMCSICKRVRVDASTWESPDCYITRTSDALVSHGLCPDCAREHYPEYLDDEDTAGSKD